MSIARYDVAQVCVNGHLVNPSADRNPEANSAFCDLCDAPTIKSCIYCHAPIRGPRHGSDHNEIYSPPSFCYNCGKFFPWGKQK